MSGTSWKVVILKMEILSSFPIELFDKLLIDGFISRLKRNPNHLITIAVLSVEFFLMTLPTRFANPSGAYYTPVTPGFINYRKLCSASSQNLKENCSSRSLPFQIGIFGRGMSFHGGGETFM